MRIALIDATASANYPQIPIAVRLIMRRFGITVDTYSPASCSGGYIVSEAVEATYDGCIVALQTPTNALVEFMLASHDWPVLVIGAANDTTWTNPDYLPGTDIQTGYCGGHWIACTSPGANDLGDLVMQYTVFADKSANWNSEKHTAIIEVDYTGVSGGTTTDYTDGVVMWRYVDGNTDNICLCVSNSLSPHMYLVGICYWLAEIAPTFTPSEPMIVRFDVDDIQLIPPVGAQTEANCVAEVTAEWRSRNAVIVAGICENPAGGNPWAATDQCAYLKANTDVWKWIIHPHSTVAQANEILGDDATFPTVAAKIAAYEAKRVAMEALYDTPVAWHYNGYCYTPTMYVSQAGCRALMEQGVVETRMARNDPTDNYQAHGRRIVSWPDGLQGYSGGFLLCDRQSSIYGGSSSYNWNSTFLWSQSTNWKYAYVAQYRYTREWMSWGATNVMWHGANLAVDGDRKLLLDAAKLGLFPLIDNCGADFVRLPRPNDKPYLTR